jgi:hypothetical protein
MSPRIALPLFALVLPACAYLDEQVPEVTEYTEGLRITLSSPQQNFKSSEDAYVVLHVENTTEHPITFYTHSLTSSILIRVYDAKGRLVPRVPPPMPVTRRDLHRYRTILKPGANFESSQSLNIFSPPLQPGHYRVSLLGLPMNPVAVTIADQSTAEVPRGPRP